MIGWWACFSCCSPGCTAAAALHSSCGAAHLPWCATCRFPPLPFAGYEPHSVLPFGGCVFCEHAAGMPRSLTNTHVASTSTASSWLVPKQASKQCVASFAPGTAAV